MAQLILLNPYQGDTEEVRLIYEQYKQQVDRENSRRIAIYSERKKAIDEEMNDAVEDENNMIKKNLSESGVYRFDPPNLGPYPQAYLMIAKNDRMAEKRIIKKKNTRRRRRNKSRTRRRRNRK